ncbi:YbaN family protein [Aquabacterium sp.]|uniref:YbaN family protein n=1 Tax=Aquabacterium sp. TaxID=1872578 RepID=UPI002B855A26|nr:YbaN family protein [Aquabacterium sp.]HSW07222.1 YbaN family protein [Aquabacterium sp.]
MTLPEPPASPPLTRPLWRRMLWLVAGVLSLATGIVGIFVPLLPTTPFVLLAAFCFSRSSARCERWLLTHPRFGPTVRDWREHRAVPLRAKQASAVMMTVGSAWAAFTLPLRVAWLPALCCLVVGIWLWRLPTRQRPE